MALDAASAAVSTRRCMAETGAGTDMVMAAGSWDLLPSKKALGAFVGKNSCALHQKSRQVIQVTISNFPSKRLRNLLLCTWVNGKTLPSLHGMKTSLHYRINIWVTLCSYHGIIALQNHIIRNTN
jgi:hypothetical protein